MRRVYERPQSIDATDPLIPSSACVLIEALAHGLFAPPQPDWGVILRRYWASLLLLSMSVILLSTYPAMANNIALPSGEPPIYRANNRYHWFAYAPTSGPDIVNGFEATRTQSYEGTDLVTSLHGTGVDDSVDWDLYSEKCYGCHSGTILSIADCRWVTSGTGYAYCRHWHVIHDGDQTDALSAAGHQQLACHETGHTVGLLHPRDGSRDHSIYGCMPTGVAFNGAGDARWLRAHNETHISDAY